MCGKITYLYKGFMCDPELVEKYRWKALSINNTEGLLWFCCSHKMDEILNFRNEYELWKFR